MWGISIMTDAFSRCHPILNFFYFAVVLGFTMFIQHPVYLAVSFVAATAYSMWLNGVGKVLKINFLLTIPSLLIVALLNPMLNHYGVTPLLYIESNGNWVTLEALVYGIVLGCVLFIMILWFSCYNQIMTSDKFIYLFGRIIPAMSLMLSMALRFVPHFIAQLKVIRNGQKCVGMDVSNGKWFKKVRYALNMVSILVTWALENAIETAAVLKEGLKKKGYQFFIDSPTNQQFVVLENSRMEELKKDVQFGFWEKADDSHTVVRFATSWATRMEDVQKLLSLL